MVRSQSTSQLIPALTAPRGRLSAHERRAYISAVKCIRRKSSLTCPLVAGARNHFDDFQALHIKQAIDTHFTALFLPWHRYFTWAYERALRECGYEGYQPYWEWSTFASNPTASPVFDGSDISMSGNGEKVPHDTFSYIIPRSPNITLTFPPQDGGGCLVDGPFANLTVAFGPVFSSARSLCREVARSFGWTFCADISLAHKRLYAQRSRLLLRPPRTTIRAFVFDIQKFS